MLKKYPNSSLLNILTQAQSKEEIIAFIHLKVVPDHLDTGVYWFESQGSKGKANFIWKEHSIKQWLAVGNDKEIHKLFKSIITHKEILIDSKSITFKLPDFTKISHENQPGEINEAKKFDSFIINDLYQLPPALFNKENLEIICGYKNNDKIKTLYPYGCYEKDFIYNNYLKKIFGIVEHRQPFLTFRGVRHTSINGKGSKEIRGFFQENYSNKNKYYAEIKNNENKSLGKNQIDKKNGIFNINLSEPCSKGKLLINKDMTLQILEEFIFIQEISIKINMVNNSFKDIYGRTHMIISKNKGHTKDLNPFSWQGKVYHNSMEAGEKLSDQFREIFNYLGEYILIADPYYLGQIKQNITHQFDLEDCQKSFINAVTHQSINNKLKNLIILGCNSRANDQFKTSNDSYKSKAEERFKIYEQFFKSLIIQNKYQKFFPTINVKNSEEDFHGRYWFSFFEDNGIIRLEKCVVITNSLGNMKEVDIIPLLDEEQVKIINSRFMRIVNNVQYDMEINCQE